MLDEIQTKISYSALRRYCPQTIVRFDLLTVSAETISLAAAIRSILENICSPRALH
jgi:hypothetical protein